MASPIANGYTTSSAKAKRAPSSMASWTPVLTSALFARFSSRGNYETAGKVLSAMRNAFGGHIEKPEAVTEQA